MKKEQSGPKITVRVKEDGSDVAKISTAENIFAVLVEKEDDDTSHLRVLVESDGEFGTVAIGYIGVLKLKKEFEEKYPEITKRFQGDVDKAIAELEVK